MRLRSLILLQFILLISSLGMDCTAMDKATLRADPVCFAPINSSPQEGYAPANAVWMISLFGCERIQLPGMGRTHPGSEVSQGLQSPEGLAVYARGMPVHGSIEIPYDDQHGFAPSGSTVCIAPLSLSAFLAGDPGKGPLPGKAICTEDLEWEGTGNDRAAKGTSPSFSIPEDKMAGKVSGLYAVYALDRNQSLIAPAQAFFLTEGDAFLQAEDSYLSENQFIRINLSSGRDDGRRKLFAAAIMSRRDYDNATIALVTNESKSWPVLALSLGSRSMEVEANPATLKGQLMDLITLMPENSAISMQESTQSAVDLILLGDGPWDKGEYVLNCAIYAPGAGLQGLKQKIIKIY